MKTKVVEFMDNHAGAIIAGVYAVTMGTCIIMYKRYLNNLLDTTDVFTKKVESEQGLFLLSEHSMTQLLNNVIRQLRTR